LVEGTNVRDHNNEGFENSATDITATASFADPQNPNREVRLDMYTISFGNIGTLNSIDLIGNNAPNGEPFIAGLTGALVTPYAYDEDRLIDACARARRVL
jgi:hypothetical protein